MNSVLVGRLRSERPDVGAISLTIAVELVVGIQYLVAGVAVVMSTVIVAVGVDRTRPPGRPATPVGCPGCHGSSKRLVFRNCSGQACRCQGDRLSP
jgi:hypothetical protein